MKLQHRTVHLHGPLKELCNGDETVEIGGSSVRKIAAGLASRYGDKVKKYIRENRWQVFLGEDQTKDVGEKQIDNEIKEQDIHFYPVIEGASGRAGQIILGVVLIVVGVFMMGSDSGLMVQMGAGLIAGGVGLVMQGLFAPSLPESRERPDERPSFLFNGATNTSVEGAGVPLVFGRCRTGTVTISAGIDVESRQFTSPSDPSPGDPGLPGPYDPRVEPRLP